MNHKELVDQFSANIFKNKGKIESRNSWLETRNYFVQLDDQKLKAMLKEKKFLFGIKFQNSVIELISIYLISYSFFYLI